MTDSNGDAEQPMGTSTTPQDVASNFTLTGGTCKYYPPVDGKWAEPRNCADCLLKEGCAIDFIGMCTDANKTDPSMDYREAQALDLVLPAGNKSTVEQRWFFPALTTSYCPASDSICALCREKRFWVSIVDVYDTHYDSRYCVGTNGCVCVSVCEYQTWRVTNHNECLTSIDRSVQLGARHSIIGDVLVPLFAIGTCLVVALTVVCIGIKRRSPLESAIAYVSVEDASDNVVAAALKLSS